MKKYPETLKYENDLYCPKSTITLKITKIVSSANVVNYLHLIENICLIFLRKNKKIRKFIIIV